METMNSSHASRSSLDISAYRPSLQPGESEKILTVFLVFILVLHILAYFYILQF